MRLILYCTVALKSRRGCPRIAPVNHSFIYFSVENTVLGTGGGAGVKKVRPDTDVSSSGRDGAGGGRWSSWRGCQ